MSASISTRFSWNAGALAGSAIGASLWMPVAAFASGWPTKGVALALTTASVILFSAFLLWRLRQEISAFGGLLILLAVGFLATGSFFVAAQVLDLSLVDRWRGGKASSPLSYAWVLLIYPALAIWFWVLERRASNSEPSSGGNG